MRVPAVGVMTTSPMAPATLQGLEEQRRGAEVQLLGGAAAGAYTISSGAFKPTTALCSVDTEASAASDDLDRLTAEGTETLAGFPGHGIVILRAVHTARTVVVRHLQGAIGSAYDIELATSASFSLDDDAKRLVLELRGTRWYEVDRFYAADSAPRRAALGLFALASLAAPANPGDNGKLVTASAGGWVYAAPAAGGDGVKSRAGVYAGGNRNYSSGGVIRYEEVSLGVPTTDGYVFTVPSGSTFLRLEAMAQVERQNEDASHDYVTLRVARRTTASASFDETGLLGSRGLPSRTFFFRPQSDNGRLKEVRLAIASGVFPVTAGGAVRVQVDGIKANSYKVNGGRTKCWLALAWM